MESGSTTATMSSKSIRYSHGKEDRISDLPDAIILHILSFMDAKDAVGSGVWSKRFAYLWTNVPCLHFQDLELQSIFSILLFHKLSNLQKVSVIDCYCDDVYDLANKIEFGRLIRLLSLSNVKDFTLEFDAIFYMLPQHFYSNPSLKKLALNSCIIATSGFVDWKSLQSLSLSCMDMFDNTINDVLAGCPSLELLEFSRCSIFTRINLTNNKCLRKLVVDSHDEPGTLEISAPNLQSLVLSGSMEWSKCKVLNAGSLIDCCLDFDIVEELSNKENEIIMLASLLEDLSHAEVVTIGKWVLQVLSLIELKGLPCPMSKTVKCLKLELESSQTVNVAGIACLLRSLNCLEKLFINISEYIIPSSFPGKDLVGEEDKSYRLSEKIRTGIDLKLKTVEICGLVENGHLLNVQDEVFSLIEFLMKNARFMENMTIGANGSKDYLLELTKKMQSYPRSSPLLVIKVV